MIMTRLETKDIQGLVLWGYGNKKAGGFLLVEFTNKQRSRHWLKELQPEIMDAGENSGADVHLNLALTYAGLKFLDLPAETLDGFSREFAEGMVTPERSRMLGDVDDSSPAGWNWGAKFQDAIARTDLSVHAMLMIYAADSAALDRAVGPQRMRLEAAGIRILRQLEEATELPGRKEHFGFRDGIAQPLIEGANRTGSKFNTIAAGEIVLGYENGYDKLPGSPHWPDGTDFGRNGSYLVFRQLEQDVPSFWRFAEQASQNVFGHSDAVLFGSKMVGRWPSGAPLVESPDADAPELQDKDDFGYNQNDALGARCPFGAHIRRSNPRDWLLGDTPADSMKLSNRHRIIRRGRPYGNPITPSMEPSDMLEAIQSKAKSSGETRGLHFLCMQSSISRQFEFIQDTWINNPNFAGLYAEADPVLGRHRTQVPELEEPGFSIPVDPLRLRAKGISRFVNVRGGAYFFMPGLSSLKRLAELGDPNSI